MKLWEKGIQISKIIEDFTIGKDKDLDLLLAKYDLLGSMAHVKMLAHTEILDHSEAQQLISALKAVYKDVENNKFTIEEGVEDVHSQVELALTKRLGDIGKKIHTARSRNDQVLLDIRLFTREKIQTLAEKCKYMTEQFLKLSNTYKDILLPGYTHLQIAMPSSFGLWFGAYAESLIDDMQILLTSYNICNQNPLGSAAGYGSSFPIDRKLTTELLGFDDLNYNVVYAQMGRGKTELIAAYALASIASTLAKFAYDACLFMSQNFGFISLPDELTTGSSIMPHKKNPDVFELLRAKCNKIQALPNEINLIKNNLPSGYFRDMQIIKESYLPVFYEMDNCLSITSYLLDKISVNTSILDDGKYTHIFSLDEVNLLVQQGIPFRDAYKIVGEKIEEGNFKKPDGVTYSHEGSISNLCNKEIQNKLQKVFSQFHFNEANKALRKLIKDN